MKTIPIIGALVVTAPFVLAAAAPGHAPAPPRAPLASLVHYPEPKLDGCTHGMSSVAGAHFVVFACNETNAAKEERQALSIAESLYGPETGLMGTPLDNYGPTGDGKPTSKTDIYLVYGNQALTREGDTTTIDPTIASCSDIGDDQAITIPDPATAQGPHHSQYSAYIIISRKMLERCAAEFGSSLTHEYFHVLSMRYNAVGSCPYYWFQDASAVWAEWYFDPDVAPSAVFDYFDDFQDSPGRTLTDNTDHSAAYGDFIWPMFMQQQPGGAELIARAWKAMVGKVGCDELNDAVQGEVSFASKFDAFAVENFDTELRNLSTNKMGWPDNFGPTYQDLKPREGTPPKFPQVQPKTTTTTFGVLSSYPWHATTDVSLAPLSARYQEYDVGDPAESVEFDFSGLGDRTDLGITLIAADHGLNGSFTKVKVTGNTARICFAADGAVDGTGNTLAGGRVYVILDDHASAAKVTGSYTVKALTACAASVSGTITVGAKNVVGNDTTVQTATLDMTLTPGPAGLWDIAPSSTYSEIYKETEANACAGGDTTLNADGSGTLKSQPNTDLDLNAYENPYAMPPQIPEPFLFETATGTYSGCVSGTRTVYLQMSPSASCPAPIQQGQVTVDGLFGRYTNGKAGLDFSCSDQYTDGSATDTNTVTGTLTATDPAPCGLWTEKCSILTAARRP